MPGYTPCRVKKRRGYRCGRNGSSSKWSKVCCSAFGQWQVVGLVFLPQFPLGRRPISLVRLQASPGWAGASVANIAWLEKKPENEGPRRAERGGFPSERQKGVRALFSSSLEYPLQTE